MITTQELQPGAEMSSGERFAWQIFRSKVHIALMPVLLTGFWQILFRFPLPWAYYAMIALHTLGGALANLLTDQKEDTLNEPSSERRLSARSQRLRGVILLCYLGSFIIAVHAGLRVVLFGALMNALAFLYGYPIPIRTRHGATKFRIKSVVWLKNAYDSLQWSVALILGMYIFVNRPLDARVWLPIAVSFLMAFFINLIWDIRDMPGDRLASVNTIPVCYGERVAFALLHVLNLATGAVGLAALAVAAFPRIYGLFAVQILVSAWFIERYRVSRDRPLASHLSVIGMLLFLGIVVFCHSRMHF